MTKIEQIAWARQLIESATPELPSDTIKRLVSENVRLTKELKAATRSRDDLADQSEERFKAKETWRRKYEDTQSAINSAWQKNTVQAKEIVELNVEVRRLKKRVNRLIQKAKVSK